MTFRGPTSADILASKYATAMPGEVTLPQADTRHYFQAVDNMINVFAIRPEDKVLFLTDPLLDRRIVDCITGVANSRGVFPREFMAPSTQLPDCPDEIRGLVEDATFVVSSWFCSVNSPFFVKLRKEKGQRWVKITYFRNLDLLQTPQARFPVDLVGEIVRATARMYPKDHDFDMHFSCPRGSDLTIKFTPPDGEGAAVEQPLAGPAARRPAGLLRALHADPRPQPLRPQLLPRRGPHQAEDGGHRLSAMGHRLRQALRGEDRP